MSNTIDSKTTGRINRMPAILQRGGNTLYPHLLWTGFCCCFVLLCLIVVKNTQHKVYHLNHLHVQYNSANQVHFCATVQSNCPGQLFKSVWPKGVMSCPAGTLEHSFRLSNSYLEMETAGGRARLQSWVEHVVPYTRRLMKGQAGLNPGSHPAS